tara:strand:- start:452 stop:673 length:222 start_codon:yes stop_codon:yes gene_type:complete
MYISLATGLLFFVGKFVEQRFIKKTQVQMKILFRDSLLVIIASILGNFVYNQFAVLVNDQSNTPNVFVNEPDF